MSTLPPDKRLALASRLYLIMIVTKRIAIVPTFSYRNRNFSSFSIPSISR
ncbi:hypothetical protein ABE169_06610 [Bacillus subtilis]